VPIIKTTKYVVTQLDLTFFTEPQKHTFLKRKYFQTMIPLCSKVADMVLTISKSTSKDLLSYVNINPSKVKVTYLAASSTLKNENDKMILSATSEKYKLPTKFILFLGVLEPRKNVAGLIKAYAKIDSKTDYHLVIAGSSGYGWNNKEVYDIVDRFKLRKKVHFIGTVDEADKAALYSLAECFVYPSFYEGFGIPVLEAMACKTPVITSNVSSLPEVGGDAAIFVNPADMNSLVLAINKVLEKPKLRYKMVEKGMENIKKFTWEQTAEKTYKAYEEVRK
jgi:glycosyltransferase involved in cell wall biosynthesis